MGPETEDGGEEIGSSKVGGDEGVVYLTTAQTWNDGAERSSVGPFRESMEGHVGGKDEDREVVGSSQTKEGTLHVCFDGMGEGSVRRTGRGRGDSKVWRG